MASVRGVVDTAPLFEKRFGQLAGLGWIGKNTTLINERFGSWLFLAALLTSEELDYDKPAATDCCGSCRACIDACPTGALVEPRRLDARKCISYLTRAGQSEQGGVTCGNWLFGCDACQEACPCNRHTPPSRESVFYPGPKTNPVDVSELLMLDEAGFRVRFRHTPLWRAKRETILRNASRND